METYLLLNRVEIDRAIDAQERLMLQLANIEVVAPAELRVVLAEQARKMTDLYHPAQ